MAGGSPRVSCGRQSSASSRAEPGRADFASKCSYFKSLRHWEIFFWPICDAIIYNTEFLFIHFQMLLGTFPVLRWVCRTRNALKQKPACCGARARWRRRAQSAAAAARGRREVPGSPGEPRRAPGGAGEHRAQRAGLATICFSSLASWGPHGSVHSFRSDSAACLSCDRGAECLASHSRFPHL